MKHFATGEVSFILDLNQLEKNNMIFCFYLTSIKYKIKISVNGTQHQINLY